nr:integrase core domain-containing protein [Burkholderia ubonensis]
MAKSGSQKPHVEAMIQTLKEQRVHRQRLETLPHVGRSIADLIHFFNHRRPH